MQIWLGPRTTVTERRENKIKRNLKTCHASSAPKPPGGRQVKPGYSNSNVEAAMRLASFSDEPTPLLPEALVRR